MRHEKIENSILSHATCLWTGLMMGWEIFSHPTVNQPEAWWHIVMIWLAIIIFGIFPAARFIGGFYKNV